MHVADWWDRQNHSEFCMLLKGFAIYDAHIQILLDNIFFTRKVGYTHIYSKLVLAVIFMLRGWLEVYQIIMVTAG